MKMEVFFIFHEFKCTNYELLAHRGWLGKCMPFFVLAFNLKLKLILYMLLMR